MHQNVDRKELREIIHVTAPYTAENVNRNAAAAAAAAKVMEVDGPPVPTLSLPSSIDD